MNLIIYLCNIYLIRRTLHADNDSLRHPHITFDEKRLSKVDLEKTVPFLVRKPSFHTNIKVTLHFRNNIGLKDSLDTTEYRVYNKNSKFNILHAQKSANFLQKKTKKALLSLIETSIRFDLNI